MNIALLETLARQIAADRKVLPRLSLSERATLAALRLVSVPGLMVVSLATRLI